MDLQTKQSPRVKIAKPYHDESIEKQVVSILRSGMLVQGSVVKQFEAELAQYIGCRNVVAVNSGTAALHAAITVSKNCVGKNESDSEVVTTPLSFSATANAAIHSGCRPVFVDVDEGTFNIDPSLIKEKISDKTIAIEPVDVYGLPADLDSIRSIARSNRVPVVEDAAESIGASYKGKKVGNISTLSCFSTYATKNLHTGEGGFVTTNDDSLAEQIRMFRNQGQVTKYNQKIMGYNFRMLEFCAVIGLAQVPLIEGLNAKRRASALDLKLKLSKIDCLGFQEVDNPSDHAWYMFAVTVDERRAGMSRDQLVSRLKERGVEADVAWPTPIHLQPYYRETFGFKEGDFPNAEKICKTVFQLPIQPFLTSEERDRTASTVKEILSR